MCKGTATAPLHEPSSAVLSHTSVCPSNEPRALTRVKSSVAGPSCVPTAQQSCPQPLGPPVVTGSELGVAQQYKHQEGHTGQARCPGAVTFISGSPSPLGPWAEHTKGPFRAAQQQEQSRCFGQGCRGTGGWQSSSPSSGHISWAGWAALGPCLEDKPGGEQGCRTKPKLRGH